MVAQSATDLLSFGEDRLRSIVQNFSLELVKAGKSLVIGSAKASLRVLVYGKLQKLSSDDSELKEGEVTEFNPWDA